MASDTTSVTSRPRSFTDHASEDLSALHHSFISSRFKFLRDGAASASIEWQLFQRPSVDHILLKNKEMRGRQRILQKFMKH
jgi:hypothetical protein